MAGCGAEQIAAMLSELGMGSGGPGMSPVNMDDISGAIENSEDIPATSGYSTGSSRTLQVYKSKEKLKDAVKKKKEAIERAFKMMHYAEEVDLCFLVDCTGSMGSYIARVKSNIKTWYERLRANYKHMKLRVAFVRYTDFDQPADSRTTWIDFTMDVGKFLAFVDSIAAPDGVGGDTAEDVFGGLEGVTKLAWRDIGTKVLIHFADAPCHGKQFYNGSVSDDHPDGDPEHRDLNELMNKIRKREIQYHFGYINESETSKMVNEFDKVLLERGGREMTIQTFNAEEAPLMDEAVYHSITTSISATLEKLSTVDKPKGKVREFELMNSIPEWDELEPHGVTVSSTSLSTSSSVDLPTIPKTIKRARQPFAKGGVRLAYHAYMPEENEHVVMKEFLMTDDQSACLKRFMEVSLVQSTASSYASEFNREKPSGIGVKIEFATCGIMECPADIDGKRRYFSYEPFINGNYQKFNGNNGYITMQSDKVNNTCQAFSHYTWVKSEKRLVVCDIQGVKTRTGVILTDPAIHDKNVMLYGATNLGMRGMKKFFQSHRCNEICIKMGLERSPHQK